MFWMGLFKFGIFTLILSIRTRIWCVCSGYASVHDAYAQRTQQFLTRMLRVRINSSGVYSACFEGTALCARISTWRICSVHAPVPDSYAQCTHQFLMRMLSARISSLHACWGYTKWNICKIGKLMRMLSLRIKNWWIWSRCAPVPDSYAQRSHQFLAGMLSLRTSSWCACSVHASVPYLHAEGIQNEHLKNRKTDAHKELMHMVRRVRISSWHACSACASVPDPYAQRAH
jgi:hypothetical protein